MFIYKNRIHRCIALDLFHIKGIKAKWEESLNDKVNFDQMKTCFRLCNMTTECTYLRYIQFKILNNRLMTQTLLLKIGISESESCLYCKSKKIDMYMHYFIAPQPFNSGVMWRNG